MAAHSHNSLSDICDRAVERAPGRVAVRSKGRSITYAELHSSVRAVVDRWTGTGLRPGEVVAVQSSDRVDYPVALLAALRCGVTYLPLAPTEPADRVRRIVARAERSG